MNGIHRALLSAVALTLLVAPAAQATLPKFSDRTIVVGKSIGGVKLGMGAAAAKKAWGGAKGCLAFGSASCIYRDAGSTQSNTGEGSFGFPGGKVTSIYIQAPFGAKGPRYVPPLSTPKTAKGIRLGSTVGAVKKAYPKAVLQGTFMTLTGKGGVTTSFSLYGDGAKRRVQRIEISRSA
jgi:hypothetical protein